MNSTNTYEYITKKQAAHTDETVKGERAEAGARAHGERSVLTESARALAADDAQVGKQVVGARERPVHVVHDQRAPNLAHRVEEREVVRDVRLVEVRQLEVAVDDRAVEERLLQLPEALGRRLAGARQARAQQLPAHCTQHSRAANGDDRRTEAVKYVQLRLTLSFTLSH